MNKDMCYRVNVGPTLNRMVKEASDKVSYEPCPEGYQAHAQQSHFRQRICLVQRSWCREGFGMSQERKWGLGVGSKESRGARWGGNERPWSYSHVGLSKELEFSLKCSGRQAESLGEQVPRDLKTRQISFLKQVLIWTISPWPRGVLGPQPWGSDSVWAQVFSLSWLIIRGQWSFQIWNLCLSISPEHLDMYRTLTFHDPERSRSRRRESHWDFWPRRWKLPEI